MTVVIIDQNRGPNGTIGVFPAEDVFVSRGVEVVNETSTILTQDEDLRLVMRPDSAIVTFGAQPAIDFTDDASDYEIEVAEGALIHGRSRAISAEGELIVANRGTITGSSFNAIDLDEGVIVNHGLIESLTDDAIDANNAVEITNFGRIFGGAAAIYAEQPGTLVNHGQIVGEVGVFYEADDPISGEANLINAGEMLADISAILIEDMSAMILNSGLMTSFDVNAAVVWLEGPDDDAIFELLNSGAIEGPDRAIDVAKGRALVRNTGEIIGDVEFAGGNDLYQGRNGRIEGVVSGGDGVDRLIGGAEENTFGGGAQNDTLRGRGGNDDLDGEGGADLVDGGAGDDLIRGGFSADRLLGRAGDDEIYGDQDPDRIFGGRGDDLLYGGSFSDTMFGGLGDDVLGGGNGFDVLHGGRGDDVLIGGAASDTFVLRRRSDDDAIADFQNGMDVVDLTAFGLRPAQFAAVVAPALNDAGAGATLLDLTQLGGNGSVLIQGLAFAQADASDFIL